MQPTLWWSVAFSALSGVLYAYVGLRLARRAVPTQTRAAHRAFLAWWGCLAVTGLLGAFELALYQFSALPLWLYQVFRHAQGVLVLAALAGLTYYLAFLYLGPRRAIAWVATYYVGLLLLLETVLLFAPAPQSITDNGWSLSTLPAFEPSRLLLTALVVLLLGPEIVACIAYAGLYPRAKDRTQRYRIALVSGSILAWLGYSLAAGLSGTVAPTWQLISQVLSVAAAVAILAAYLPPASWRSRWGLRSISDESV